MALLIASCRGSPVSYLCARQLLDHSVLGAPCLKTVVKTVLSRHPYDMNCCESVSAHYRRRGICMGGFIVLLTVAHVDRINQLNTVVFAGGILLNAYCADNDGQTTNTEKIKSLLQTQLCWVGLFCPRAPQSKGQWVAAGRPWWRKVWTTQQLAPVGVAA